MINPFDTAERIAFRNTLKEFVSKESSVEYIFKMIHLHLIMDDESNDIAVALVGLIKEKKTFNGMLYKYILSNLTYYIQSKLQNSENNLEREIENLKSLSLDNIDYKKQLMLNKNIPTNVKSLALEKIEEMKSMNNDYFKQITYVKTIINFPWSSDNDSIMFENLKKDKKKSKLYLEEIEDKLKNLSYGHEEPKKLLLQIIGKWISNPKSMGSAFGMVGPPGVGKSTIGEVLGEIYCKLGLINSDKTYKFVKANRGDLIGQYLGHTDKKTQAKIDEALGGVLFIDEAYSLGSTSTKDIYAKECLDTLNRNLTEKKGEFVCIIAGYRDELDKTFFRINPGLRSRFNTKFHIEKYSPIELSNILFSNLTTSDAYKCDEIKLVVMINIKIFNSLFIVP